MWAVARGRRWNRIPGDSEALRFLRDHSRDSRVGTPGGCEHRHKRNPPENSFVNQRPPTHKRSQKRKEKTVHTKLSDRRLVVDRSRMRKVAYSHPRPGFHTALKDSPLC